MRFHGVISPSQESGLCYSDNPISKEIGGLVVRLGRGLISLPMYYIEVSKLSQIA